MHKLGIIFLQVFSLLLSTAALFAQEPQYTIPSNSSYERLLSSKKDIGYIYFSTNRNIKYLPIKDIPFINYGQDLIKSKKDLYIFLNASGIVYKFKEQNKTKDSLIFVRIDSTEHFGYNIDCFPFTYKNSLYNIGGYGFWRYNGHLRIFSEVLKQWDIAKVNREVPVIRLEKPTIWVDLKDGRLITLCHIEGNESEKNKAGAGVKQIDTVMMLDIEKRDWKSLGILDPTFTKTYDISRLISNTKMGLLVNNNRNIELWNLDENKVYQLTDPHYTHLLNSFSNFNFIWSEDSTIYLGKNDFNKIDSILLTSKNLIPTDKKIYKELSSFNFDSKNISTTLAIMVVGGFLFYGYKRRNKHNSIVRKSIQEPTLQSSYPNQHIYSRIELDMISLIITNIKNYNKYTSVDELNHLLGMSNKTTEMQKRKRSDTLRSINEKFALDSKREDAVLIKRKKADSDGRLNEFFISEEDFDQFLQ